MPRILVMIFLSLPAAAQTQIDLRTQTKRVDFTAAVSTKPLKTGSALPATCEVGDMFFKTDATPGANLYGCTAVDNWSIQSGISSQSCGYDTVDGTLKCRDAQGVVYAAVRTANGGTANQWVDYISPTGVPHTSQPTAAAVGAVADPGSNGVPYRSGPGVAAPATADRLSGPFSCQDTGSSGAYACDLAPPITAYNTGTTYWFKANSANTGAATINFNSLGPKRIVRPSGQDLAAADIRGGQWVMLTYDGTTMQMQSQTANTPAAGVSSMFGRTGAVTAQAGDYTTAQTTESGNLYFTNARARAALGTGGPLTLNLSTGIFDCPACLTTTTPADTDLYGNFPHLSVIKIQGHPVASVQPADLQYLGWNNSAAQWEPKTLPTAPVTSMFGRTGAVVAAAGDYTTAQVGESGNLYFTNARAWAALSGSGPISYSASTGVFGCPNCITSSTPADTDLTGSFPHLSVTRIQGRPVAAGPPADAQYLGWNTSANQWEPKTLPAVVVASVFGRTGPIASQNGDYSFAQISGSVGAAQLPAAAMRTDQGNTVTAGTQNFSGAAHTLPMKSGLTASLPSLCVTGELYFATDAPPGQNTYGCTATNAWSIQGNLTVKSDDSTVGQRGTINFEAGAGTMTVMTDSGSEINVLLGLDTAVVQTPWAEQSGSALLCASTSGSSSSYQCSLHPTLQEYTAGMTLHWTPDVNGAGGPTSLNVDTLGAIPVKRADGVTDPSASQIPAGPMQTIWYDGTSFRLAATTVGGLADSGSNGLLYRSAPGATQPATADLISQPSFCQDTGSVNAYACNLSPAPMDYVTGTTYWFGANTTNTGPATINFNSLGARAIKKYSATDLMNGDITAGQWVMLTYDGVNMQMQSETANPPASTVTPTANAIPRAGAIGKLAQGWIDFSGYQTALGYTPENAANKGQANGYASLGDNGLVLASQLPNPTRAIGYVFDGGGSELQVGKTGYYTVPFSCTIRAWNLTADTGTVTIDAWKAATGAGIPTVSNTITASATPAIATGTALHSTALTGWTTAVNANDVVGFNVKTVNGTTLASLVLECN